MSTIEKLFVQIFERKKWIIEQVKHQTLVHDQHLASKLIIDGISPPSWLWTPAFQFNFSDPTELKKEELISGLLLRNSQSAVPYSASHCSLYNKPFVASDHVELSEGLGGEARAFDKGYGRGDVQSELPECAITDAGCASSGSIEPETGATSPEDRNAANFPEINAEPAQSLARIQRSKSRQRALQLRSSAKAAKSRLHYENDGLIGPGVSASNDDHDNDLEIVKPVDIINECCAVEEAGVGNSQSKERGGISRKWSDCENELFESIRPSSIPHGSCGVNLSTEKGNNGYDGSITTSRTSCQQHGCAIKSLTLDSCCDISKVDSGNLMQPPQLSSGNTGADKLQKAQDSHSPMHGGRSSSSQKNLESCGKSAKKQLNLGNSAEEYIAKNTRSRAIRSTGRISKAVDSNISSQRVTRSRLAMFSKSQNAQATQISAGTSIPSHKNVELCTVEVKEYSDRGLAEYYDTNVTLDANREFEGISKPANSSNTLDNRVRRSTSRSSNKPIMLVKSLIRSEEVESCKLQEIIGARESVQQFGETTDTVDLEECAVAEIECLSDRHVEALACSGPKLDRAVARDSLEGLVSSSSFNCSMLMKPKQLNLSNLEEYSLNENCSLSKKLQMELSEKRLSTLFSSTDLQDKVTTVNYQEKSKSSQVVKSPEERVYLNQGEEPCRGLSKGVPEETAKGSISKRSVSVSSVRETSEIYEDYVPHTLLYDDAVSNQNSSMDHLTASHVDSENFHSSFEEEIRPILSQVNADMVDVSFDNCIKEPDIAEPMTIVSEDSKLDPSFHGGLKVFTGNNFVQVNGSGPLRNRDGNLSNLANQFSCTLSADETRGNYMQQDRNSIVSVSHGADLYLLGSCIIDDKNLCSSKLRENETVKKSMQPGKGFSSGVGGSLPPHKRRKIDSQLTNAFSASPGLRLKPGQFIHEDCGNLNRFGATLKAIPKPQQVSSSQDEEPSQLFLSGSPVEDTHENVEHQQIEGFKLSSKMQVEEAELGLGERDRSASSLSKFIHGKIRVPIVSSLTEKASGDFQGGLTDEVGVKDPTCITFDAVTHCNIEENQCSSHLEDELEKGNTEHFNSSERRMQETRSNLEVNGNALYCSVDSSHSRFLNLLNTDPTTPLFESFIMHTDCGQPCIPGYGINCDKLDPSAMIERTNILDQGCKSASAHTPLSHISSTYKLHTTPNLYHSIPNGLLECMDPSRALPINDTTGKQLEDGSICLNEEASNAFHGKSYSDFPTFSCANWDIRKPYTSPVGNWDRITSYSSSSEKKRSLTQELPCINEENENMDEVADTLPEVINSEVMFRSAKREPLADITEDPNPLTSVSEAEIFASRCSLDSVSTEISIPRSCKVKQNHGKHTSCKGRYVSKEKENHSIPLGANGGNRATGSLKNRFSKPKLSGKTSLRKDGPSLSGRESKCNNIVSNISSFIPLVQQKQAATAFTGKRDIKVKALEAAEAAKRLAQKKENERKLKKEALKLKRERLGQENLKQLELQKIKKEEERKKKEANIAAKKRQREVEGRNEKERKRQQLEERWRLQREHNAKEMKCRATDDKAQERKDSNDEIAKHTKRDDVIGDGNLGNSSETEPGATRGSTSYVVTSNLHTATENLVTNTNQEQSYEISPYQCSDDEDEDEDEDEKPNNKFVPSWASKKSLAMVISSQQKIDPEVIFPLESFCDIAEVVLPRKHRV